MFQSELQKIADKIDRIIREDDFPEAILPAYLKEAVKDYPSRGGKRLRPAILMWSCGLLGGNPETARFAAAAVEIYHNWTLVHDDIIDNDKMRRGRPSSHFMTAKVAEKKFRMKTEEAMAYGKNFAILAGDIQQGWAANMLLKSVKADVSPELTIHLSRRLHELVNRDLISGEALDVEMPFVKMEKLKPSTIEDMLNLKTGVLLRYCAESGALIGLKSAKSANDRRVEKIGGFASLSGIAFQLKDDWLGIFGNEEKLGKPVGSDLSERKPTLLLYHTWKKLSSQGRLKLMKMLGQETYSSKELDFIRKLMRETGAEKKVIQRAEFLANSAKNILSVFPDNKYRKLLLALSAYLTSREK
jgi:geranylgeranyl diphosphate synthase type I